MSTTHGTRQHGDTVICVRDKVCQRDVQLRSISTVMENAGFWEADLIAVDFSIRNKRRRPCDLKDKVARLKFRAVHLKDSIHRKSKSPVHLILYNCPVIITEKSSHWLAGRSECSRHAEDSRKLLDGWTTGSHGVVCTCVCLCVCVLMQTHIRVLFHVCLVEWYQGYDAGSIRGVHTLSCVCGCTVLEWSLCVCVCVWVQFSCVQR